MTQYRSQVGCIAAVILISLHITSSAKTNSRPVYEVVNEQAKADDEPIKTSAAASLPYGNPLAGNSQQNARLYAHNQQAMFHAERVRQHKAQLQRWMKTPQLVNSYMRSYHESQENQQLALEQEQADLNENKPKQTQRSKETLKRAKVQTDATKTTKPDASKPEKKRIHRSYGSDEFETVYLPSTAFSQAAALHADGSVDSNPVYSKYYPAQEHQSVQDIEILNSLLNKNPSDQLTEFNALINSAQRHNENHDKELEKPTNLYFYLKNSALPDSNVYAKYTQTPKTIEIPNDDYKPIQEVDEADQLTEAPDNIEKPSQVDSSVTNNIQYINTELINQISSAGYNPLYQEDQYYLKEEAPTHQALQYGQHQTPAYNYHDSSEDLSERYLHHNINKGVQYLNGDGTGVTAYGDDNVSVNTDTNKFETDYPDKLHLRDKRSVIDKNPLVVNEKLNTTDNTTGHDNNKQQSKFEPLVRVNSKFEPKRKSNYGTFTTTPNFPIGEASDYGDDSDDYQRSIKRPDRNYGGDEVIYDDQDYNYDDDHSSHDYDYEIPSHKQSISISHQNNYAPFEAYAPSENYLKTVDLKAHQQRRPLKRHPDVSTNIGPIYSSNSFSISPPASYGAHYYNYAPAAYKAQAIGSETNYRAPAAPHLPEPVYVLTHTQLAKIVGHHNLNIGHLDLYQLPKGKRVYHYPRKYRKYPGRNKKIRNIFKLHRLHVI